jgi:hypothetical protein
MAPQNDLNSGSPLPLSESRLPRRNRNGPFNRSDRNTRLLLWCTDEKGVHHACLQGIKRPSCIYMGAQDQGEALVCSKIFESQSKCGRTLGRQFATLFLEVAW